MLRKRRHPVFAHASKENLIRKPSLKQLKVPRIGDWRSLAVVPRPDTKLAKKTRRKFIRRSIIAGNILILIAVASFVLANRSVSQTIRSNTINSLSTSAASVANPLDQLSSSQIALAAAQLTGIPELTAIKNQADSDNLLLSVVPNDSTVLAKPQIVTTALKSKRDIVHYTTVAGDTVGALATKYNVTADSIRWSNNLTGNILQAGIQLVIPPVNGIVYTVKSGDTPASLASKYSADQNQIITYNDAEISGLQVGEQIVIPNGKQPAPVYQISYSYSVWGGSAVYGYNGYDYGYCTWYVSNRRAELGRPVPSNLGNAYTWYRAAVSLGLPTGFTPKVGAVMVNESGNHVAVVEQINSDGSFLISEMNSYGYDSIDTIGNPKHTYGGWGKRDYKVVPAENVGRYKYIY